MVKRAANIPMLTLRVELKTSRLLNGCSNQLSYESEVKDEASIFYTPQYSYFPNINDNISPKALPC